MLNIAVFGACGLNKLFTHAYEKKYNLIQCEANLSDAKSIAPNIDANIDGVVCFGNAEGGVEAFIALKNIEFLCLRSGITRLVYVDIIEPNNTQSVENYVENDLSASERLNRESLDALVAGDGAPILIRAFCPLVKGSNVVKLIKSAVSGKTVNVPDRLISISSPNDVVRAINNALSGEIEERGIFNVACSDSITYAQLVNRCARAAGSNGAAVVKGKTLPECTASNERLKSFMRLTSTATTIKEAT